jgi:HK97 family phage major capsid protein
VDIQDSTAATPPTVTQPASTGTNTANLPLISGQADVPMQMLEQSGVGGAAMDQVLFRDLTADYDYRMEQNLITGIGQDGVLPTPQGILNVAGLNSVQYTGSVSATSMFGTLGQAIAVVGNKRHRPPSAWLMTTSRAAWLGSSEDQQNRPLMIADDTNENGSFDLLSFQVLMHDALPTNIVSGSPGAFGYGTTNPQDVIIACRPEDMLLFESAPTMDVHLGALSGTLEARVIYRRYVGFLGGRYPSSITVIWGSGMQIASGF